MFWVMGWEKRRKGEKERRRRREKEKKKRGGKQNIPFKRKCLFMVFSFEGQVFCNRVAFSPPPGFPLSGEEYSI
jgi:hypothetical protein